MFYTMHLCKQTGATEFDGRVRSLCVDFTTTGETVTFWDLMQGDWDPFDEHVRRLSALEKVVFGFRDMDEMTRFLQGIVQPKMPYTYSSTGLKCVVWHHTEGPDSDSKRYFVDPDLDDTGTSALSYFLAVSTDLVHRSETDTSG